MKLTETKLKGAYLVELDLNQDDRGFFARTWDQKEFVSKGLDGHLVQCSVSFNKLKGTLRGMHHQIKPHEESKLVRCTMGSIFDVIVDIRPQSPTFKQWIGVELTADNRKMIFIPFGFAHGFQTLTDHAEVFYQMSEYFVPENARGFRWDDPTFNIRWPEPVTVLSEKDRSYPDFDSTSHKPKNA